MMYNQGDLLNTLVVNGNVMLKCTKPFGHTSIFCNMCKHRTSDIFRKRLNSGLSFINSRVYLTN